ncbi:MAG: SURF1 family protein [Gammaproteobacteria bacterium]
MKKNKFNPGIKVTIFFVFFSCVFFSLGLWQIERGQDKQSILDQFENNTSKAPSVISDKSQKWDRVRVKGTWQKEKQIFIDNVINKGLAGYKVLTPLQIASSNQFILVDRGWVPQNKNRNIKPNISIKNEEVVVTGLLENHELGFVLSDDLVYGDWPKISQTKNLGVINKAYEVDLVPYVLLAEPLLKDSLEYIKPVPTNMLPSKHYGYSAQWFTMLIALAAMYLWWGFKNEK